MQTLVYKIQGMDCAEEVSTLKKELAPIPGVQDLAFDIFNAKMTVTYEESALQAAEIMAAVARTGMTAVPWDDQQRDLLPPDGWTRHMRSALTAMSGVLLGLGILVQIVQNGLKAAFAESDAPIPLLSKMLFSGAVIAGVWLVLPKAWIALRRLRSDMNLLMVIAICGAIAIGQWAEAAAVAFLFALSITLEAWTVARARRAVEALMALTPPKARVLHVPAEHPGGNHEDAGETADHDAGISDAHEHLVDVADVLVGTTILVKPGEKFPLDGKITQGQTSVNQAPITGESMPVPKGPGSEVYAATINGDGTVEFTTTKAATETTLARIIALIGEAQSRRSPSEQWVETFARVYTPAVMLLAVAVILVPPLVFGGAWSKWIYEGLVLLIIGCPCALVISTPVSIVAALASAAKNGVLIKGGIYVELPSRLKAIALDKTGTLTEGHPSVQEIIPLSGHTERELIAIAAAIESRSEHPLARAVLTYAEEQGIRPEPAKDFQSIQGKGASAVLNGIEVWIGSHRYLEERGQETSEMHEKLESLASAGASILVVGNNEHVCGFIAVADRIRENAKSAVAELKALGIDHIVMLTGDNKGTADAVGRETGVVEVKSELLPEDKVKAIEDLVARYGVVAMIGDGVNDAPAMARATLGIAMGAVGTDAAIETADIALMSDDLSRLPWLIRHSQRTVRIIRQNIIGSLGVKGLFVMLTLSGHASLWAAIGADTGMSLLVVVNALRLLAARE